MKDLGLGLDINSILKQLESETKTTQKAKKHVVVVDDDHAVLKIIKEILEKDYRVTTISSGKMALQFFLNKSADLILLDYEMPGMSGVEVFRALREDPKTRRIPVIFVTGINEDGKIREALSLYPCAYLLKPINAARLCEEVKKNISRGDN